MKTTNFKVYLFSVLLSFLMFGCSDSDDSQDDNSNLNEVDLIIGEWLVITENDYFCGTNDVAVERATDPNQIRVYNEDGTWQDFEDGEPDWTGTWENLGDGNYSLYYDNDQVEQSEEIEFVDNGETMRFGVDGQCFEGNDGDLYTYTVWIRQ